jgi:hypothetical protein
MLVIVGDGFALPCEECVVMALLSWNVEQPELQTDWWGYLDGRCNFYFQNNSSPFSTCTNTSIINLGVQIIIMSCCDSY